MAIDQNYQYVIPGADNNIRVVDVQTAYCPIS